MTVAAVREWVGTSVDEGDIFVALAAHDDDPRRAALSILRTRRADLTLQAAKFAVSGDYSQDTTANIKAIDEQIRRLERELGEHDDGLPTLTSAPICGPAMGRERPSVTRRSLWRTERG